ncbi:MAG: response regulator [Desulfobacteraceae bacterium]|nr:response regulator [Desulfobacteraceae bacterium]MBU4055536.1 response regulator [Pseudomonadota bacterium]
MKKKILVVDDNRLMLSFMIDLLEKEGHEVLSAEDGLSALDILNSFVPDIIFVDLIMPKIDGERLCRILRTRPLLKNCFIVVLSGAVAEIGFDHLKVGADRCIAKGPMNAMKKHILSVIKEAGSETDQKLSTEILGLEGVFPRQMTKELLVRNRYLEAILGSIAEGVLEIFSDRVVYTNAAAEFLFNRPQEEILSAYPPDLFDGAESDRIKILLKQSRELPGEIGFHHPLSLNNLMVSIRCIPISDDGTSLVMLIADVTRRKQMELKLQHSSKMEAIGTIASGIAHNFRNTLAGILTNSQILQMNYGQDQKIIEVVQRIISSVRKGVQLVDGLLQFSRKQGKKEFESVDIAALIDETHLLVKESFGNKIKINIDMDRDIGDVTILGEPSSLSLALMNLCTNAYHAMPDGGELTIKTECRVNSVLITVSDTGTGMDSETLQKCFDPFFTHGEVSENTGMGLAVTYGIVKSHEGDIQVQSNPGKGAVFKLTFPLFRTSDSEPEDSDEQKNQNQHERSGLTRGGGKKVLVVDDEKDLVNALKNLLEFLDYNAVSATSGLEAIETYKSFSPDIVLMDINMPGMNGFACAEKILALDSNAKIAIMSGYDERDNLDPSKRSMIAGYLTKPMSLSDLSKFLARWS